MGVVAKFPRTKNFYSTKLNFFVTLCKTSIRGLTDIPNSVGHPRPLQNSGNTPTIKRESSAKQRSERLVI
jgi:hypothetical protein